MFAFVLLAGCSKPSETERLRDELEMIHSANPNFRHNTLPSPQRLRELNPERPDRHVVGGTAPAADRVLVWDEAFIPALIEMLQDKERRVFAAYVLTEIGGDRAAKALWAELEPRLKRVRKREIYSYGTRANGEKFHSYDGHEVSGVDSTYYSELMHGVAWIGRPVVPEIVVLLSDALKLLKQLHAEGRTGLNHIEEEGMDLWENKNQEVVRASDTLTILGAIGDPRATPAFREALKSPLDTIRHSALRECFLLADKALIPDLEPFLHNEEPWREKGGHRVCDQTVATIAYIRSRSHIDMYTTSAAKRQRLVERYRREARDR